MLRSDDRAWFVLPVVVVTVIAQLTDPGTALDLLIVAPALAAFVFQDRLIRAPEVFALLVVAPIFVVVGIQTVLEPVLFLSVTMVLYVSARVDSTVRAALIALFAGASPLIIGELLAPEQNIGWQSWILAHAFTFAIGRLLHRQQALIADLEQARQALAEQAVAEERRRIARELHDLAGHTLAAMLLHVTGARHVLRRDLDDADRALADAESVGRASLDQIRATVAALRTDERGTDPALVGSADLEALVDEYRRAGLDVAATIAPDVAELAGPTGIAVHRITREALANVARHASEQPGRGDCCRRSRNCATHRRRPRARRRRAGPEQRPLRPDRDERAGPCPRRQSRCRHDGRWLAGRRAAADPRRAEQRVRAVMIRVVIVDDQPVVRSGIARILGPADGFEVVAECGDGDEVAEAVASTHPDLVLMDVRMRRMDGVTATRSLTEGGSGAPVLVLTTFDDDDALWGALDAGAAGFVLKDASADDLIAAARAVAGGAAWLDPKVAPRVLTAFRSNVRPRLAEAARVDELTDREHEVLKLMARGATNTEIAGGLFVSEATVKTHVGAIFTKLGVRDRAAAIVFAFDHGLVDPRR